MIARFSIVLFVALALACSSAPGGTSVPAFSAVPAAAQVSSFEGDYRLVSIDGNALPYRPSDPDRPPAAGPGPLVIRGSLLFEQDGTFRYVLTFQSARTGRPADIAMNGTWRRDGDAFTLKWPNGAETPGRLANGTFTFSNLGMTLSYQRAH